MVEIFLIDLLLALVGLTVLAVFIWIVKKLDDRNQYNIAKEDLTIRLAEQEQWKRRNNKKV
jgi:di/tricarboxylate transporter|tara:strand:+ start:150 stop:332 length:183 start_codon:yes stop_codon:yes gene_type:complete